MTFCAVMKAMEGHLTEHNILATCDKVWRKSLPGNPTLLPARLYTLLRLIGAPAVYALRVGGVKLAGAVRST
jgi:hypothetical protein